MRKYLGLFATAVMLTAAVACQKEFSLPEDPSQDQTPIFVLEATVDMDGTRAFLDKSGDIFWQAATVNARSPWSRPTRRATASTPLSMPARSPWGT